MPEQQAYESRNTDPPVSRSAWFGSFKWLSMQAPAPKEPEATWFDESFRRGARGSGNVSTSRRQHNYLFRNTGRTALGLYLFSSSEVFQNWSVNLSCSIVNGQA